MIAARIALLLSARRDGGRPAEKRASRRSPSQTKKSGGPIDPDQAKLAFDAADLSFEILPETETLRGVATLSFTARAPLERLAIDLDRNLPVDAIAIDGVALPPTSWSNPEGKLRIALPRAVRIGGTLTARTSMAGNRISRPTRRGTTAWSGQRRRAARPGSRPRRGERLRPVLAVPRFSHRGTGRGYAAHHRAKGLKAPSNGTLLGVDTLPDGRTIWNWRVKHPNTYGIALNVGPYEQISGSYKSRYGNTIPMFYWYLPGEEPKARGLFAEFAPTLDFFESEIGPYPFGDEKLGVVGDAAQGHGATRRSTRTATAMPRAARGSTGCSSTNSPTNISATS